MTKDIEHLFIYLLVTLCLFFQNVGLCLFLTGFFFSLGAGYLFIYSFMLLSSMSSLYILDTKPFPGIWFADIFPIP